MKYVLCMMCGGVMVFASFVIGALAGFALNEWSHQKKGVEIND